MKKFEVVIPEKRIEVVRVTYYIDAESEEQVRDLMKEYEFMDKAEFVETRESQWGSDVDDVHYDEAEIREVKE
jgi:DNA-dependent RNA polymerase auxiliary subunit epsilon